MSPIPVKAEGEEAMPKVKATVFPPLITPARPPAVQVICVGAGGTGGRVLAPLIKMLRQGDRLDVVDHDVVEQRNLLRQHFTAAHLGRNKAEVAVQRLRGEANRVGVTLQAWPALADATTLPGIVEEGRAFPGRILLGCVDNREARAVMSGITKAPRAWIDAGNEVAGGQVLMTLDHWPIWGVEVNGKPLFGTDRTVLRTAWQPEHYLSASTMKVVVPQLLEGKMRTPAEVAAEACAVRMDTQTVAANQMAAALMINMLGWLLDEVPFSNVGAFFHTCCTIKPVPVEAVVGSSGTYSATIKPV